MNFETWYSFYYASWQSPWALMVVPVFWLVARSVAPRATKDRAGRFVSLWAGIFLLETMLDPVAGLLAKDASEGVQTAVSLFFVLAGDFRIFSLVFVLALGVGSLGRGLGLAAGATAVVPVVAWCINQLLAVTLEEVPGQVLWLVHESLFVVACYALARFWLPQQESGPHGQFLGRVLGYAAGYYALWAGADLLILAEVDAGWLVRCVPNQLYYALTVPVIELLYRASANAPNSTSTQTAR